MDAYDSQFLETMLKLSVPDAVAGQVLRAYFLNKEKNAVLLAPDDKEQLRKRIADVQPKSMVASTMAILAFLEGLKRDIVVDGNVLKQCYEICELAQPKYMDGHLLDIKNKPSYRWIDQDKSGGFRLNPAGQAFVNALLGEQSVE